MSAGDRSIIRERNIVWAMMRRFRNTHCSFWNWNRLDFRKYEKNRLSSSTGILMYRFLWRVLCRFGVAKRKSRRKSTGAGLQRKAHSPPGSMVCAAAHHSWCGGELLIDAVMCCVFYAGLRERPTFDYYSFYTTVTLIVTVGSQICTSTLAAAARAELN